MLAFRDRMRQIASQSGVDAIGEALIDEIVGEGAWNSFPDEVRRIFTHNGVAVLADLQGEWLRPDTDALAAIDQPVLLVGATDSPPEFRDPNEVMAQALPNARRAQIAGGHLIDPAAPEVLTFIEEILRSG
jgi:pimeloyl-ACP methyl ester carboxylesterase